MKKLLITTMAAVSVGLCAKADDADYTKTSFEDYEAGSTLTVNDEGDLTWTSSATDPLFVISNKIDFANWTKPSRPDYWATSSASDEKALTIDTDAPLFCKVNDRNSSYTFSNGPIFFDSVVQFTATDVAAEPESGDKLRVWLYESSEEVAQENSGDVSSTKQLVVTAAYFENGTYVTKHYYTDVEIEPDSWHRLTIKSFINNDFVTFSVWVDKTLVSAEGVTEFLSLQYTENKGGTAIQCVAFDGKGAVDDIVFTTTDPFYVPPVEVEKVNVSVSINDFDAIFMATLDSEQITSGSASYEFDKGTTLNLMFMLNEGYELVSSSPVASNDNGIYSITVVPNSNVTVEIVVRKAGGGDVVTYPTVKPNGDSATQGTLSESAVAAIEEALAGVETMPDALTVIVNEKEYFGDEAVAKINEVVAMFKAAKEGESLKFFDASGIMKVSFKATNPLMETETAEATDYEAKVGEAAAAVTSDYTVNKETIDLTPGVAGENEAVTFKLVIKPVSSTGSDTGSEVQE